VVEGHSTSRLVHRAAERSVVSHRAETAPPSPLSTSSARARQPAPESQ
jgi:hypothetical protein